MKVPGPKVTYTLQSATEGRTSGGGVSGIWAAVTTMQGSLGPISAQERAAFGTETETTTHRAIIGSEEVGASATSLIPKNRLTITNSENDLAAETFQITGVQPFRLWNNKIATFEVMLRKVD